MAVVADHAAAQKAADDAAVEDIRQKFGDQEAAKLAADLYKLRRSSGGNLWGIMPRWVVIVAAIWLAVLETATRLPDLLLAYPKYQADKAEFQAKLLQPDLVAAELQKARYEAKAAVWQPDLTEVQLDKSRFEAKAAEWQPFQIAAQGFNAQMQFLSAVPNDEFRESTNIILGRLQPITLADIADTLKALKTPDSSSSHIDTSPAPDASSSHPDTSSAPDTSSTSSGTPQQ